MFLGRHQSRGEPDLLGAGPRATASGMFLARPHVPRQDARSWRGPTSCGEPRVLGAALKAAARRVFLGRGRRPRRAA
eukprot:9046484-Alexandrium_andersonii.AAC.1